ncbi:hypothetical protein, partial [Sanguibacter sp. 25GB23B1]|uniref:hypothetical protein n=1 Tax=unclassified Sanguibacter TaxID=2645534 RepID=UPI0032AE8A1A
RSNGYSSAPRSDRSRDGGYDSRPPRDGGYQSRPARDDRSGDRPYGDRPRRDDRPTGGATRSGNYESRPPREGGYESRPPRDDRSADRSYGDRAPRRDDRSSGGPARSNGYSSAPRSDRSRDGGYDSRPPRDAGYETRRPPASGARDDRTPRRDDRSSAPRNDRPYGDRPQRDSGAPARPARDDRAERAPRTDRPERSTHGTESGSSSRPVRSGAPRSDVPDRGTRGGRPDRGAASDDRSRTDGPPRVPAPALPEGISFSDLDRDARGRLRTLSKENAETVGLHLVMAGRLIDTEPELAYEHAQEAVRRAGRVDIVREAAGLTAYSTGRFAEALRELRTVRRLNGSSEHLAVMADCERGLGRPERAVALAASPEAESLDEVQAVELAIVVSGARLDLGEGEAAQAVLDSLVVPKGNRELEVRVIEARIGVLESMGRADDAARLLATLSDRERASVRDGAEDDDIVVFDLDEETDGAADSGSAPADVAPEGSDAKGATEPTTHQADDDEGDDA